MITNFVFENFHPSHTSTDHVYLYSTPHREAIKIKLPSNEVIFFVKLSTVLYVRIARALPAFGVAANSWLCCILQAVDVLGGAVEDGGPLGVLGCVAASPLYGLGGVGENEGEQVDDDDDDDDDDGGAVDVGWLDGS